LGENLHFVEEIWVKIFNPMKKFGVMDKY